MREDQHRFLELLGQLPARLTVEQAAWVLNCQVHDMPILVGARLIKPLGSPPANGIKFFCTAEVLEMSKDKAWLSKVSNAVYQYWQHQNARKRADRFNSAVAASPAIAATASLVLSGSPH